MPVFKLPHAAHWIVVYERGGNSNLVRDAVVEGLSAGWGATRCGASKLLEAFRSVPVKTVEVSTRLGERFCQLISTA